MENVRLILHWLDPEHVSARRQHRLIRGQEAQITSGMSTAMTNSANMAFS